MGRAADPDRSMNADREVAFHECYVSEDSRVPLLPVQSAQEF